MPITSRIDHERKLVVARAFGAVAETDVFGYQRNVWSRQQVAGYDELIDMTDVTDVGSPSVSRVQDLASVAANMDTATSSRLAIIAPTDLTYGLGRMFQAFRELEQTGTKTVGVFRTLNEATAFLNLNDPPTLPPLSQEYLEKTNRSDLRLRE